MEVSRRIITKLRDLKNSVSYRKFTAVPSVTITILPWLPMHDTAMPKLDWRFDADMPLFEAATLMTAFPVTTTVNDDGVTAT